MNDNEARKRIGQRIAALRKTVEWTDERGIKRVGMSQQQMEALTGIRQSHITRIEHGYYSTNIDYLEKMANALGHHIDLVPDEVDG